MNNDNPIGLINLGEEKKDSINLIVKKYNSFGKASKIKLIEDLSDLNKTLSLILIFHLGKVNEHQVNLFIDKVKLFDVKFLGLIVIEN